MTVYNYHVESEVGHLDLREQHIYGSSRLGMRTPKAPDILGASNPDDDGLLVMERGLKQYELSNHLGNVLLVVSDQKIAIDNIGQISHYDAEILSYTDYYPFGSVMSERTGPAASGYRYGFNGMERVDEFSVEDGSYDFGARMYDARLGRWWSVDPILKSHESSYAAFANNPLIFVDVNGMDTLLVHLRPIQSAYGDLVLFKVDFTLIRNGVFINKEIRITSEGTSEMYVMGYGPTFKGDKANFRDQLYYNLEFKQMRSHSGDPGWENTILISPILGRGQFWHPGFNPDHSAGCLIPCSGFFDITNVKGKYTDDGEMISSPYVKILECQQDEFYKNGSKDYDSDYSKELLSEIRFLFNKLNKNLPDGEKLGFLMTTQISATPEYEVERIESKPISMNSLKPTIGELK